MTDKVIVKTIDANINSTTTDAYANAIGPCPYCGNETEVTDIHYGNKDVCKTCGNVVVYDYDTKTFKQDVIP